ncbi:MAG: cytochrome c [candidate division KSB1 bacterium]|nr:cytochrome c [candidate division KSB1 bacterium]
MKKGFASLRLISLVLGISVLVLACGGDKKESSKKSNGATQQATTTQTKITIKGDPVKGQALFMKNCLACHGPDGRGIKGLGKDLVASEFVATRTDEELLEYVLKGRTPDDPLNTTGVAMPPKGGNPALKNEEIIHIIAYLRQINKAKK